MIINNANNVIRGVQSAMILLLAKNAKKTINKIKVQKSVFVPPQKLYLTENV